MPHKRPQFPALNLKFYNEYDCPLNSPSPNTHRSLKSLAAAILDQSIRDLHSPDPTLHHDALRWFHSTNTSHPLSFLNVCSILGLDPQAVRSYATTRPRRPHRLRP